jgi:hypothetical protein
MEQVPHLIQMFDVGVAPLLKVVFKQELLKPIGAVLAAQPGRKLQTLLIALVESFIKAVRRGATRHVPIRPRGASLGESLSSEFAVDLPEPGFYPTVGTGADINEMVLTSPEGLDKLAQIQFHLNSRVQPWMRQRLNYRAVWDQLASSTVSAGRALSPPPPFYTRLDDDPSLISDAHLPMPPR